jgi:hypothetical protein
VVTDFSEEYSESVSMVNVRTAGMYMSNGRRVEANQSLAEITVHP